MTLLNVEGLRTGYGAKRVLDGIDLQLRPGEILAVLGHNGAGKTTLLRALMGLLPHVGRLSLNGEPLAGAVTERQRRGLRLLPEGRGIFPDLSVAENIDVVSAANCTGTADLFDTAAVYALFPVLDERRGTRAGSMSGGQQQMLALSLAVLGQPRCLLLDEPSIGLAPNLVERIFAAVASLCRDHGMGAVLVEQNVAAAMRIADRVMIMNNGAWVFSGTPEEARAGNVWAYF